jgi:hypothetical protein
MQSVAMHCSARTVAKLARCNLLLCIVGHVLLTSLRDARTDAISLTEVSAPVRIPEVHRSCSVYEYVRGRHENAEGC